MAGPIRFRYADAQWDRARVERALFRPLDEKFGARLADTSITAPPSYSGYRLDMDNGDLALIACHDQHGAYWLGNTETPQTLWRTEKYTFDEAPYPVARWAQRELLAELRASDPWLAEYNHLSWFFLPVFFSKDGRDTTREFFRNHAAGFPDASREAGLSFYESLLSTGVFDEHRYTMATKLGTSDRVDLVRMRATMAEFNTAKLLTDVGYQFRPEVELDSGYALDFQVEGPGTLVEVTRPEPPTRRRAGTPAHAIRDTVSGKQQNQLAAHPDAVVFVDCSSFRDDEWQAVMADQPEAGHEPAVVYRARPDGRIEGYIHGETTLNLRAALTA